MLPHTLNGFIVTVLFMLGAYQVIAYVWQDWQKRRQQKKREQRDNRRPY